MLEQRDQVLIQKFSQWNWVSSDRSFDMTILKSLLTPEIRKILPNVLEMTRSLTFDLKINLVSLNDILNSMLQSYRHKLDHIII